MRHYKIRIYLTLIAMFCSVIMHAQKVQHKNTYEVNINGSDGYARFMVMAKKVGVKAKEEYTYYWYALNKVITTKGGYDGALLNGSYVSFYANDNLKEKGYFVKGLKTGEWTIWYNNGIVKETGTWRNGMLNGVRKTYDIDGKIVTEEHYRNDVYNGTVASYRMGKVESVKYYKNGVEYVKKPNKVEQAEAKDEDSDKKSNIWQRVKSLFHHNKDADSGSSDKSKNE